MDNDSIKKNILEVRKRRRLSQTEMAEKLGISRTAYRNIEKGETRLFSDNLNRIAEILGVVSEELILGYSPKRSGSGILYDGDGDGYGSCITEMKERHMEEVQKLTSEIARLSEENSYLKRYIRKTEDLIKTKDEIISMMRRLDSKE